MSRSILWLASLLCTLLSFPLVSSSPAVAQGYQLIDLGTLGTFGTDLSMARGISPNGLVTGGSYDGVTQTRVFLYSGGVMHDFVRFDYITIGNSVNTSGQIAGDVIVEGVNTFTPHGFVLSGGVFTDLGVLPGFNRSLASAINQSGQVAVTMYNFGRSTSLSRGMLWQQGTFTDVGALPSGMNSFADGLNDFGQIVGGASTAAGTQHAFLWQSGRMSDLGTLGGLDSQANAINNNSQIVGWSQTSGGSMHPCLWQGGRAIDLGLLSGFAAGTAQAINHAGQVVGTLSSAGFPGTQHAFVYRAGVLSDLNNLLYGNPGITLTDADGIDDAGEIIVNGQVNFVGHAYLLKPHLPTRIPAAPTGLAATAGVRSVTLTWQPSAEALQYNVKRATTSAGPYTTIGVVHSGPSYTDTSLTTGRTYFYVVSGVNALGQSANSNRAQATPR